MREIMFRAWDDKGMILPEDVYGDIRNEYGLSLSGEKFYFGVSGNGPYCPESIEPKYWPGLILMQFTNLLDKNGIKIYEGDIVKRKRFPASDFFIGEVVFKNGCFVIEPSITIIPEYVYNATDVEVIGNVYENSDLIIKKEQ